ncbi:esterase OVCA2 isoform X6 [Lampetra planeri]
MCVYCVYCVCTVCVQCGCTVCTVCTVRVHCVQCVCAVCVQCGAVCALPARCRPPRHGRRARRVSSSAAVYISAPNVIPAQREEEEAAGGDGDTHTDDQRAWWFTVDPARAAPGERLFDSTAASALSVGFDDSVLAIARTLTELGPFHGILGFSQGASMASLILAMQRDNDARFSFGFAVLVSGFRSSSTEHRGAYAGGAVPTPSLHVRGLTDRVIAHQRSAELQQGYSHASELVHPGGHFVPASPPQKAIYLEFLERFQRDQNGQQ